jgi:hypothetical protein
VLAEETGGEGAPGAVAGLAEGAGVLAEETGGEGAPGVVAGLAEGAGVLAEETGGGEGAPGVVAGAGGLLLSAGTGSTGGGNTKGTRMRASIGAPPARAGAKRH